MSGNIKKCTFFSVHFTPDLENIMMTLIVLWFSSQHIFKSLTLALKVNYFELSREEKNPQTQTGLALWFGGKLRDYFYRIYCPY